MGAIRLLSTFLDSDIRRRVDYAALDVEEFGSVYESLLDFHPDVQHNPWGFALVAGSERKQTGSYYTPRELVQELIESALVPVIEERLAKARGAEAKKEALLSLKVCDPAAGSGHFLLAAARRIAKELARVESGEEEPSPEAYRDALRQVIRRCIYAVDKNALAVDLCKVALWIEGHNAGLPLSFLDQHIRHGDSLVGVYDLDVLSDGIPDDAFKALTSDDKEVAKGLRKRNKEERVGQLRLDHATPPKQSDLARDFSVLTETDDQTPADVHEKERLYAKLRGPGTAYMTMRIAADLWTYAFFALLQSGKAVPTTADVRRAVSQPNAVHGLLTGAALAKSTTHPFFHWPLEFPEVFEAGGFDVVLGNPPWERIKLQEQEFFSARDREIAEAPNKATRTRLIKQLAGTNPTLLGEFHEAQHDAEAQSQFVRTGGRFPLGGRGNVNTYVLFAEMGWALAADRGRTGLIVPTGIATDDTTKHLFRDLIEPRHQVLPIHAQRRIGVGRSGLGVLRASGIRSGGGGEALHPWPRGLRTVQPQHPHLPDLPQPSRRRDHARDLRAGARPDRRERRGERESLGHLLPTHVRHVQRLRTVPDGAGAGPTSPLRGQAHPPVRPSVWDIRGTDEESGESRKVTGAHRRTA